MRAKVPGREIEVANIVITPKESLFFVEIFEKTRHFEYRDPLTQTACTHSLAYSFEVSDEEALVSVLKGRFVV